MIGYNIKITGGGEVDANFHRVVITEVDQPEAGILNTLLTKEELKLIETTIHNYLETLDKNTVPDHMRKTYHLENEWDPPSEARYIHGR